MLIHLVGTRPNFMKCAPIYNELKKRGISQKLIHSGQHYDKNMSDIFFDQLELKKPDINLNISSKFHGESTGKIMIVLEKYFLNLKEKINALILYGDVNTTLSGALVGSKLRIPIVHVESGLRSFDFDMPEEINRIITDKLSNLLFAPYEKAAFNLIMEGIKNKVIISGNNMIDSMIKLNDYIDDSQVLEKNKIEKKDYILITLHRPSNVDDKLKLTQILNQIERIANIKKCIFSVHPRTKKRIKDFQLDRILKKTYLIPPQGYLDFMKLQKNAKLILTDSGSIQAESTFYKIPCLTLRNNTEWTCTLENGSNKLISINDIEKEVLNILFNDNPYNYNLPIYWDGNASIRIVDSIIKFLN